MCVSVLFLGDCAAANDAAQPINDHAAAVVEQARSDGVLSVLAQGSGLTATTLRLQEGYSLSTHTRVLSVLAHGYYQCSCRKGLNYRSMPTPDPPKIESNMVRAHTALSTRLSTPARGTLPSTL